MRIKFSWRTRNQFLQVHHDKHAYCFPMKSRTACLPSFTLMSRKIAKNIFNESKDTQKEKKGRNMNKCYYRERKITEKEKWTRKQYVILEFT